MLESGLRPRQIHARILVFKFYAKLPLGLDFSLNTLYINKSGGIPDIITLYIVAALPSGYL